MTPIEIPLSKKKLVWILLGALGFMAMGLLFLLNPEPFTRRLLGSTFLVQVLGAVCLLFFALFGWVAIQKLGSSKMGLRIDEQGITDHSHANSVGLIPWRDITGFDLVQVYSTRIILVKTASPEAYIERARNVLAKKAMEANFKMYGTPVSLVANSLKISAEELYKLVSAEWQGKMQEPI